MLYKSCLLRRCISAPSAFHLREGRSPELSTGEEIKRSKGGGGVAVTKKKKKKKEKKIRALRTGAFSRSHGANLWLGRRQEVAVTDCGPKGTKKRLFWYQLDPGLAGMRGDYKPSHWTPTECPRAVFLSTCCPKQDLGHDRIEYTGLGRNRPFIVT